MNGDWETRAIVAEDICGELRKLCCAHEAVRVKLEAEIDRLKTKIGSLDTVLRRHHTWHQKVGTVQMISEATDEPVELDLSAEYSDSTLCEETTKALGP